MPDLKPGSVFWAKPDATVGRVAGIVDQTTLDEIRFWLRDFLDL